MSSKTIPWLIAFTGFIGFIDAMYLTANHFSGAVPPCTISSDCERVLSSRFSTIGPIPIALFGAVYYATALLLAIAYIDRSNRIILHLMTAVSAIGIAASSFFVYLQLGPLESICIYCMISAACCLSYGAFTVWQVRQSKVIDSQSS